MFFVLHFDCFMKIDRLSIAKYVVLIWYVFHCKAGCKAYVSSISPLSEHSVLYYM